LDRVEDRRAAMPAVFLGDEMPVRNCTKDGKPGYKWGYEGTCYTYSLNDEFSRRQANEKALQQGRAIEASKRKEQNANNTK